MELYDFIDATSSLMKDKTKTLVLHKSMKQHPVFKVYKSFEYKLYLVHSVNNEKTLLLEKVYTKNTPADNILSAWNECDKEYLTIFTQWLINDFIKWI